VVDTSTDVAKERSQLVPTTDKLVHQLILWRVIANQRALVTRKSLAAKVMLQNVREKRKRDVRKRIAVRSKNSP
jgi:hypothetical protein